MTITPISSIDEIFPHAGGERGVAAFDLDDTLARPPLIATSMMSDVLEKMNERLGYASDAHERWFMHLHKTLLFQPFETAHGVNRLVEGLREKKWRVCVITARNSKWRELTFQHIKEAGLPFRENELICCGRESKRVGLEEWIGSEKPASLLFVDDQREKCEQVAQIEEARVFHFQPTGLFTEEDFLKTVVMQLAAIKEKKEDLPLEGSHPQEKLSEAMQLLRLEKVRLNALHAVIRDLAADAGCAFKRATAGVP